jgi:hypothetical protein
MKKKQDTPNIWVTAIKLALGLVILVGGTGLALWYVDQVQVSEMPALGSGAGTGNGSSGWGIAGDSPLRPKR